MQNGDDGVPRISVNLEYQNWYQQDQLVLNAILSSLSEEVLVSVVGCSTLRDVWTTIEKMHASSSRACVMQIRMALATIQKNDMSVTEYFKKVKNLVDTLAVIAKPLEDEELIAYNYGVLDPSLIHW